MDNLKPQFNDIFENSIEFPDIEMKMRYDSLIGIDEIKTRLEKSLQVLINKQGLKEWTKKFHPKAIKSIDILSRRPPLIILAGDVGSGKSELAYSIGDKISRLDNINVTLLPLSLSTRGQGMVGQMTRLISAAFDYTLDLAKKYKNDEDNSTGSVILLVDEADALAQSRESGQMHHEDKAGVNAFIRGIDSLGNGKIPVAVIMCTNRLESLDPAVKRRASEIIVFSRPNLEQRALVLNSTLAEFDMDEELINKIAMLTGENNGRDYGFTYSDLIQRLIPSIILKAFPLSKVTDKIAVEVTKSILPTPPFKEL